MKLKICCGLIGIASLLTAPSLLASVIGTGSLYITAPGYAPDQAGPYVVSDVVVSTGANPGSTFETFCLGTQINYSPNTTYTYQISETVEPNGPAPSGVGAPGYVTWGTAWLYSQFRAGLIGDGTGNNVMNDALQSAIWSLQGQSLAGLTFYGGASAPDATDVQDFLNDAIAAAALAHISSDTVNADGAFGVYALDMLSGPNSYVQPQLCIVPVPEPSTVFAGAAMLLPFGASALQFLRKSRTA